MTVKALDRLWLSRDAAPTALGLTHQLGWLDQELGRRGITPHRIETGGAHLLRQTYDHALPELVREGGNVGALAARAQGAPTRVVGLTWIDEGQAIVVAPGSGIAAPQHLQGKRLALPRFRRADLAQNRRGASTARAMTLGGYRGALASVGLTLEDVELVEVGTGGARAPDGVRDESVLARWEGLASLSRGEVDAVYVKGPDVAKTTVGTASSPAAKLAGAEVGIDLDRLPGRHLRINDGTPRPITVHEALLRDHFELVVTVLLQVLRACDWASTDSARVNRIIEDETRSPAGAVAASYGDRFHLSMAPDLSVERIELLRQQKRFLLAHGFLDRDVDLDAWVDARPLEAARARLLDAGKRVPDHGRSVDPRRPEFVVAGAGSSPR
jgi:ABC-type nitrate/sulfonate/bicarbonate transport system substrate-binding protein